MKRLILLLALLPSVAQAAVWQEMSKAAADAAYLPFTGGALSGNLTLNADLITSTGTVDSSVADGVPGLVVDILNAHTSSNLFEIREAGAAAYVAVNHAGHMTLTGQFIGTAVTAGTNLVANAQIMNSSGTSSCTASNGAVCVNDDLEVDGQLYFEENTTCTPIAGYGCITTKSDNKLYFTDGAGVEHELVVVDTFHAEMIDEDNTDAYVVNAQTNGHAYHTNGLAGTHLDGWTFDAGGGGTSHAITAIADYDGTWINVTTGDAHGLAAGDIISQTNLTDVAYEGIFVVQAVPDTTHYRVIATYTATDTGTMDQAATLIAGSDAAGDYLLAWTASATSATNNETFDYSICVEAAPVSGSKVRRKFGTATDFGSLSGTAFMDIVAGDHVSFIFDNNDSAGNVTFRNLTLLLHRL